MHPPCVLMGYFSRIKQLSLTVGRATSACGSMGETSGGTMALKHSSAFLAVSITAWGTLEQPWRLIPMGGVKKALKK